jgi:hypothetical protein
MAVLACWSRYRARVAVLDVCLASHATDRYRREPANDLIGRTLTALPPLATIGFHVSRR